MTPHLLMGVRTPVRDACDRSAPRTWLKEQELLCAVALLLGLDPSEGLLLTRLVLVTGEGELPLGWLLRGGEGLRSFCSPTWAAIDGRDEAIDALIDQAIAELMAETQQLVAMALLAQGLAVMSAAALRVAQAR